ncbi:MAG: hypothetical protein AAFN27_20870 [Pseudomonadota bacterium]
MARAQYAGVAAVILATLIAGTAFPQEWSRSGPNGTVNRSYDGDAGLSVDRNGVNGGSSSATVTCSGGGRCERDYSVTSPGGQTATGQRLTQRSPWGVRSGNTVTGPDGHTATRYRASPAPRVTRPRAHARRVVRW